MVTYKGPRLTCWGNPGSLLTFLNRFTEGTSTQVLGQTRFPFNVLERFRSSFFFRLYIGSVFTSLIFLKSLLFLSHTSGNVTNLKFCTENAFQCKPQTQVQDSMIGLACYLASFLH